LAVCGSLLPGFDPDLLEYIAGGLVEDEVLVSKAAALEFAAPLLEEHCDGDEAAAEQLVGKIWAALAGGGGEVAAEEDEPIVRKLQSAVDMSAGYAKVNMEEQQVEVKKVGLQLYDEDTGPKTAKLRAQKDTAEKKAAEKKAADVNRMTKEVMSLNLDLEKARETAATIKSVQGCDPLGSVDVKTFQLPNPGGGPDLLEDASCVLVPGHRYGLIGRNGKGKSTLLRHLAARRVSGFLPSMSVYYVHQEVTLTPEQEELTPVALVLCADVERRMLLEEQAKLATSDGVEQVERLAAVEQRLEAIGASRAEERVVALLKNLGFSEKFRSRAVKSLSGGWRVRTALAAALFAKPDVLLLDEPTNHLSIDAVMWLSREISTSEKWNDSIVVVVSHDRFFLDETCTDMLHISGVAKRLTQHRGSYSVWAERRAEQQKAQKRQVELREAKADKLRAYTQHGFKYGGSSGQIAMQQKKLKELKKVELEGEGIAFDLADLEEDEELSLRLEAGGVLPKPPIMIKNVGFAYSKGGELLFTGAEFSVDQRARICLLGENGAGKTTLVKLMQGHMEPTQGEVLRCSGVRIETVNQHHASQLDLDQTPLQFMGFMYPGNGSLEHEGVLRGHLAGCGVTSELQSTLIRGLSGGQRSRCAMAAVSYARPHVLILDEPTNNLDLEAVEALADCVDAFEGAVVLVSHDNYFVSRVAKEVWVVGDGAVKREESFASYKKKILAALNKRMA